MMSTYFDARTVGLDTNGPEARRGESLQPSRGRGAAEATSLGVGPQVLDECWNSFKKRTRPWRGPERKLAPCAASPAAKLRGCLDRS